MYEIAVISLLVSGVVALVKHNGGIQYMIDLIKRHVKTRKGAELGMAGISAVVDVCTANNTVAIVMAGGIVKEIGDEFDVPPKRAASILDIFTSMVQGLIPYGAQLLTAASLVKITPFDIIPNLYYPILMGVSALLWILLAKRKEDAPCQPSKQM